MVVPLPDTILGLARSHPRALDHLLSTRQKGMQDLEA